MPSFLVIVTSTPGFAKPYSERSEAFSSTTRSALSVAAEETSELEDSSSAASGCGAVIRHLPDFNSTTVVSPPGLRISTFCICSMGTSVILAAGCGPPFFAFSASFRFDHHSPPASRASKATAVHKPRIRIRYLLFHHTLMPPATAIRGIRTRHT